MSLDNIQLPGFVIQDLFQKSLVDATGIEKKQIMFNVEIGEQK